MSVSALWSRHQLEQVWQATQLTPQTQRKYPRTLPFKPNLEHLWSHFQPWFSFRVELTEEFPSSTRVRIAVPDEACKQVVESCILKEWNRIFETDRHFQALEEKRNEPPESPVFVRVAHESEEDEEETLDAPSCVQNSDEYDLDYYNHPNMAMDWTSSDPDSELENENAFHDEFEPE